MKLQEVDESVNESLSKWVQLGIGGLAGAAGSSVGAKRAKSRYEEEHFIDTFVGKMNGMLSIVWPKVQKSQQEAAIAKQMMDLINQGKPIVVGRQQVNPGTPQYNAYKGQYEKTLATYQEFDLAQYLMQVITQYASGYDLSQSQGELQALTGQVASTYQTNRGLPALKKIGKVIYDIIKLNQPSVPEEPSETARVKLATVTNLLDRMTVSDLEKLVAEVQKKIQEKK
jgi:hypothetical protein